MNIFPLIKNIENEIEYISERTLDENSNITPHNTHWDKECEERLIDFCSYIKNLEAEKKAVNEAISAMVDRDLKINNKIENLKQYIKYNLEMRGIKEIKSSPYFKIKIKLNPPKVDIDKTQNIPDEYIKLTTIPQIDKAKISDELKNGVILPFAKLIQETRIEIK